MKYHSRKTEIDGILFDSKAEAERYLELRTMQEAGEISELKLQPVYELIPTFRKNGKTYRRTVYKADFSYIQNGQLIVEDFKGFKTDVYKLKKKLFEFHYPHLTIKEVRK